MTQSTRRRGRPPKGKAKTAAERMRAYRRRKREAGLKARTTWVPEVRDTPGIYSDHQVLDARSLAMHCRIAQKITADPKLLATAIENLDRWEKSAGADQPRYINEWRQIISQPWPVVAAFITSMSDEATRLRSSSPFAGVLTEAERQEIYAAFKP